MIATNEKVGDSDATNVGCPALDALFYVLCSVSAFSVIL